MRRLLPLVLLAAGLLPIARDGRAACCYFSAVGKDVNQPAQKAFLTWDPQEQLESFTVQPKFEGNAADFGMVIPTPGRPKLTEMPRPFFKELAVFTILKPMPLDKYKTLGRLAVGGLGGGGMLQDLRKSTVKVLEAGVVGSLDYKIVTAERADDLYQWLREHRYSYAGDEETLSVYIQKRWFFTVMKIDPRQMKRGADGKYEGEVTPTRFTFSTPTVVYPLRITQISVPDSTEALFYVQAPTKVDLPASFSCQYTWVPMLRQALSFAVPQKVTPAEREWIRRADAAQSDLQREQERFAAAFPAWQPASLEWARKLDRRDLAAIEGFGRFDREADPEAIRDLRLLRGHLREGMWITKLRKVFHRREMARDLQFVPARLGGLPDESEYVHILPTSPP